MTMKLMMHPMLFVLGATPLSHSRLEAVRNAFNNAEDPTDPWAAFRWTLVAAAFFVALLAAAWFVRWRQQRHLRSQPVQVFRRLAGEFGLPASDQWLLVRIAHQQTLPTPLTLMLSPTTLRHHAELFVKTLAPGKRARTLGRVASVRRRLFEEG